MKKIISEDQSNVMQKKVSTEEIKKTINEEWLGTRDRWILCKVFSIKLGRPIVGEDVSEQLNHILD
jgi:hypothetical protein